MANVTTLTEARDKLDRARAQIRNMKQEGQRVVKLATHSTLMAAGGVGAGVLRVKLPKVPGTDIPSDVAFGTALVVAATLDLGGDMSDEMLAFGGGMLAASAADYTEKQLRARG